MIKIIAIVGAALALGGGSRRRDRHRASFRSRSAPAAEARAAMRKAQAAVTVMYITKERVVNLTDKATRQVFEGLAHARVHRSQAQGAAQGRSGQVAAGRVRRRNEWLRAIIDDALVTTLSAKARPICSKRTARISSKPS